jgi:hypothetical protein
VQDEISALASASWSARCGRSRATRRWSWPGWAADYAGHGVVAFGLGGDEAQGRPEPYAEAFAIARSASLISAPHAGEHGGADSVRGAVEARTPWHPPVRAHRFFAMDVCDAVQPYGRSRQAKRRSVGWRRRPRDSVKPGARRLPMPTRGGVCPTRRCGRCSLRAIVLDANNARAEIRSTTSQSSLRTTPTLILAHFLPSSEDGCVR